MMVTLSLNKSVSCVVFVDQNGRQNALAANALPTSDWPCFARFSFCPMLDFVSGRGLN